MKTERSIFLYQSEETLGEVTGNRGSNRGGSAPLGEGWRKNPFSAIAFSSTTVEFLTASAGEAKLGLNGVTGLKTREGKSKILGERASDLGEK